MRTDLTLITPTGGRPYAFSLCERWMARQTIPFEWIVVDDCDPATPTTLGQTVVRPEPRWEGENTQCRNLLLALDLVRTPYIAFIEDDDYYGPEYLSLLSARLSQADLVSELFTRYYHVPSRSYHQNQNSKHGSLFQTGLHSSHLDVLREICSHSPQFVDISLWIRGHKFGKLFCQAAWPSASVGMKGLPGRFGIGIGHTASGAFWDGLDENGGVLHSWIGDDASEYLTYA